MPARVSDTGIADSFVAAGSIAAPGANATICIAASAPPAGVYSVTIHSLQSGTVDAVLNNRNMRFRKTGSIVVTDVLSLATDSEFVIPRVSLDGTQTPHVVANNASGVGSVYHASISLTQVE